MLKGRLSALFGAAMLALLATPAAAQFGGTCDRPMLQETADKTVEVPWGTPCRRLEGSIYTGTGAADDSCNVGVPENIAMAERQYVVDETIGAVDVFLLMGPNKRPDSHLFRIEDGKIRNIHTVTNCLGDNNCGFDPFEEMIARNPGMRPEFKD